MSDTPLILAVPSKGRLQENAFAFFARAGLVLSQGRGARDYRGSIAGVPDVEVLFLSASEIVYQLAAGGAHLGVTGEDLIREGIPDADACVELLAPLGFGQANVVVAVPQAWIDVRTMTDLEEVAVDLRARHAVKLRVATKYVNLTRRFFAERGVPDYRIVESLGATEGAPAAGAAEIIVDITTTGATLAANGLKVLEDGVILRSEANLVASVKAEWGQRARRAARTLFTRIAAEEEARTTREIRAAADPDRPIDCAELGSSITIPYHQAQAGELVLRCRREAVFGVVERLLAAGARDVTVAAADYVFRPGNPLADRLFARLG
jgi:ATP phosphoribosyltransferase